MTSHEEFAHLQIALEEIEKATNHFSDENLIGRGGFGKVYKGNLLLSGQQTKIVARRLHYDYGQGDLEFWTEIMMLSSLKHRNLVSFVGYCNEKRKKVIINKYESRESLDKYLQSSDLTWLRRLQICVGIARALNYIHYDSGRDYSVIHRNVKSSKILLDDNWEPKLSGFELAMRNTSERRHRLLLAEVVGTVGYVDPTYEKTGFVTHKSDVYSFGVVLFEIMCGRKAFIPDEQKEGNVDVHKQSHSRKDTLVPAQLSSRKSLFTRVWLSLSNCVRRSPSTDVQPSTFAPSIDVQPSIISPSTDVQPSTSTNVHPSATSTDGRPPSFTLPKFGDWEDYSSDGRSYSFVKGEPSSFVRSHHTSSSDIKIPTDKPIPSPSNALSGKSYPLQPLFTMKRLDQYLHTPYHELLAQLAKSHYDEENLDDIVDPALREQMDPESFKIFSETAYNCLKEQRAQRPNIDQILRNLENALKHQMRRGNAGHSVVQRSTSSHWKENNKDNLQMSFEEIKLATQDFHRENIIGGGGFGRVFKGEVTRGNQRTTVVAKRLDRSHGQGEHHFLTELEILFEYKHENIIGLEGYCNENAEKIIVYEHASNGSLDRYLNDVSLTWTKRLKICIDVARGLAFLHGGAPTKEMVIHRDIKSANILLNADWKAKISDFGLSAITAINQEVIDKLVGTVGYVDPVYETRGFFTEKSDIYSLGVVLFEILHGKLLVPKTKDYDQQHVSTILKHIHEEGKLGLIVFEGIKEQVAPESLSTFQVIASQCLNIVRNKRPTAEEVLQQLNKALEFQEDYEIWGPKLPKDYEEIIKLSKSSEIYSTIKKKDLYNIFSKGIILQDDKVWFSLGSNGERNEMISATKFSYINRSPHKWKYVPESRFKKVAEMLDISSLMIKIKSKTRLLSLDAIYRVYLVFKFSDSRKFSTKPMYVNLTYTKGSETLHAYFATWRDHEWMMIELWRFLNHKEDLGFKFILESFSPYYCGDCPIYVEGLEFRALDDAKHVGIMRSNLNIDQMQQLSTNCKQKYKDSIDYEDGKFMLSEINGRRHLMLSAKAAFHNFSNAKLFTSKPTSKSRFQKVIELLPQQVFRINCTIKSRMLSQDTEYACYLVFKLSETCQGLHCPVKVRDLLQQENKESEILYFISPSPWNIHHVTRVPQQREDGLMEVNVWKFKLNHQVKNDCFLVNLKFTSYEGPMSGLIVYGLEFRPLLEH
uniref:uncharacterized protein LOC122610010 isoform X3 n=1 Tax=Erigeron canadensis TaxID=72917 RepID=UPI001CB96FF5|nr:uncharacterized protein LOC122610010 isoform X3 [Erigeron canadensis]